MNPDIKQGLLQTEWVNSGSFFPNGMKRKDFWDEGFYSKIGPITVFLMPIKGNGIYEIFQSILMVV